MYFIKFSLLKKCGGWRWKYWQWKVLLEASNVKADDGGLACLLQNPLPSTLFFLCTVCTLSALLHTHEFILYTVHTRKSCPSICSMKLSTEMMDGTLTILLMLHHRCSHCWLQNILYHYNLYQVFQLHFPFLFPLLSYYTVPFPEKLSNLCLKLVWGECGWKQKLRTHSNGLALPPALLIVCTYYNSPKANLLLNKKQTNILAPTNHLKPEPHLAVGQHTFVWIKN